jgi:predicted nucleic acid-binding protein
MAFLDSSVIIDYLTGVDTVVEYVDDQPRLVTSALCVYEVLEGEVLGSGETDIAGARQHFGRVRAVGFDESVALEAARLQDRLAQQGSPLPTYDLLVAASARSEGETLVVRDDDFETEPLADLMAVRRL